jgi:hypothetical protein
MQFLELLTRLAQRGFDGLSAVFLFAAPLFFIGLWLHRRRRRFKAEALEPFTDLPLRPPGESLRLKLEEIGSEFDTLLTVAALICFGCAMAVATTPASQRLVVGGGLFVISLGASIFAGVKLGRLQKKLWMYRLGFTGERLVGEELNRLLASGFHVFHDVPFENFNIDHVLVGPPGVYSVETKSVRKKAAIKGIERATLYSDGTVLTFPTFSTTKFIEQARRNAASLSKWLSEATGEPVTANAILTIPGWRIERTKPGDVNVLRPDEIKRSFPTAPKRPLSPEQIQRIAHQLTERCRLADDAGK